MIVLGVDPGATTGFAVLDDEDGLRILHAWSATPLERACTEMAQALNAWAPDLVAVEGWEMQGAHRARGACEQAWAAGQLVGWLRAIGWSPVVLRRQADVKPTLGMRRNAPKELARGIMAGRIIDVPRCTNSHELDAAAVAYAAYITNRDGHSVKDATRRGSAP